MRISPFLVFYDRPSSFKFKYTIVDYLSFISAHLVLFEELFYVK